MTTKSTLIATLGSKPQLITLAVDCLCQDDKPVNRVVIIHGLKERVETQRAITVLEGDLSKSNPQITLEFLELQRDGLPLADIATPEQVDSAFRVLYATVRRLKMDDQTIHLLIAGGRRTLTVFGMAVAQMLFDDRDRLWHLASHPALEESGKLHASEEEWTRLIPIPVISWGRLSPAFDVLRSVDDPFEAVNQLSKFRLREQWDAARIFILTKITSAESSIVSLLVREGLSQPEIAERLGVSLRTVEQHLRSIYRKAEEHWEAENINQARLVRLLGLFFSTYREF